MKGPQMSQELIEQFEDSTGLMYDSEGPRISECECGVLIQYAKDHSCYITAGENHSARMMDDRD